MIQQFNCAFFISLALVEFAFAQSRTQTVERLRMLDRPIFEQCDGPIRGRGSEAATCGPLAGPDLAPDAAAASMADSGFIVATGLDNTGKKDASAMLQAILDRYPTGRIFVPAGTYQIAAPILLRTGQTLACASRTTTRFMVPSSFTPMNASGVFILGSAEPAASIFDCEVTFWQPAILTRATVVQYPPAIDARGRPRFQIDRVRISNAWKCLDATGNSGGGWIGRLECGAYANDALGAIAFSGALDFIHIQSIHCWPFAMNASQRAISMDQTTQCISIGKVDGLAIGSLATFTQRIAFTAPNGEPGLPISIGNLQTDGDGAQVTNTGNMVLVGNWYSTKSPSAAAANSLALLTGGRITAASVDLTGSGNGGPAILVAGGELEINGGRVRMGTAQTFASVTAGRFAMRGVSAHSLVARTLPFIAQSGRGVIAIAGNSMPPQPESTGAAVHVETANPLSIVANNAFAAPWAVIVPTMVGQATTTNLALTSATPAVQWRGTSQAPNQRNWDFYLGASGSLAIRSLDDAYAKANTWMTFVRGAGFALGSITLAAPLTSSASITAASLASPLSTPESSTAACTTGTIRWDASYIYICTATNTWKRAALSAY